MATPPASSKASADNVAKPRFGLGLGLVAVLLMTLALTTTLWSWYQQPMALQQLPPWLHWLLQPYERNVFARHDFIGEDIRAVSAAGDTLWLAGTRGLLLRSRDGGASWQPATQIDWRASTDPLPSTPQKAALLPLFSTAFAGEMPADVYSSNMPANVSAQKMSSQQKALSPLPVQSNALPTNVLQTSAPQTKAIPEQKSVLEQKSAPPSVSSSVQERGPTERGPTDLNALTFFDTQHGVAVGDNGVILVTRDGGAHWSARHSYTVSALHAIAYIDASTVVAVGARGVAVVSQDGGHSWQARAIGVPFDFFGIALQSNGALIAVGEGGCVVQSRDLVRWSAQWLEPRQTLRAVVVQSQRVVAVGDNGVLLLSDDGGNRWQTQTLDAQRLSQVLALDAGQWRVVGAARDGRAALWRSADDARSFMRDEDHASFRALNTAARFSDGKTTNTIITAGAGGTVLRVDERWSPLSRTRDDVITALTALKDEFIASSGGLLLRASDGKHWEIVDAPVHAPINAMQRIDKRSAIAVGDDGTVLLSNDGGRHWRAIDSGVKNALLAVAASGDGVVLAVGAQGTLLRSADNGKTWRALPTNMKSDLIAVSFSSAASAVIATSDGVVLRSVDAGLAWENIDTQALGLVRRFAFVDARNGIAVGDGGLILRTTNAGKSWQRMPVDISSALRAVVYLDSNNVLAGGDDGQLLESRDGGSTWRAYANWNAIGAPVSALVYGDVSRLRDASQLIVATQDGALLASAPGAALLNVSTYQRYPAPLALVLLLASMLTLVPAWQRRKTTGAAPDSVADILVSDRPLESGDADYMDFSRRAAQLSRFLRHEKTELPVTLAISAEWGRGKSSLMNLLSEDLASNGFRPVWFNAWHHQKEGHLLGSLLRAVQKQALPHVLTPQGFFMRVQLLSRRGAWYLIAAAFPVVLLLALFSYFGAYPERLAAVGPNVRYMLNIENPVTITAQSMAQLQKAASGEQEKMLKYWLPVLDEFRKARHVFVDTDEMIRAMRARQNPSAPVISSELVTQVIQAAEHLRPQERVFPELGNVWTGISAVFAALVGAVTMVLNGMSVFGLRHARVANVDASEKTGTRERIAADFGRLTDVLGNRLVIMIDDLDRCSRENLLDMLEHINFLSSEGHCAIVVAIAYDRVVRHLAVSLAEGAGRRVDEGPTQTDLDEAHFYMHKLIQLMVTIRPPQRDEARKMLIGAHGTLPPRRLKKYRRTLAAVWRHTKPWVIILALAYAGIFAGSRGLQLLSPQPTLKLLEQRINAVQQTSTATPAPIESNVSMVSQERDVHTGGGGFRAATPASFPWWLLGAAATLLLLLSAAVMLYRDPQLRRQLANRFRLALAVPVREQDSSIFLRALTLWHGVVADHLQSPRALKRFLNRLRFLAMGVMAERADAVDTEAHVVALAALGLDNVDLDCTALSPAQKALLDQHIAIFGRAPNQEERALYLDLVSEVDRQAVVGLG